MFAYARIFIFSRLIVSTQYMQYKLYCGSTQYMQYKVYCGSTQYMQYKVYCGSTQYMQYKIYRSSTQYMQYKVYCGYTMFLTYTLIKSTLQTTLVRGMIQSIVTYKSGVRLKRLGKWGYIIRIRFVSTRKCLA